MIDFDTALSRLRAAVAPLSAETVALGDAAGRVLAAPAVAAFASPRRDVATRDGFAMRRGDCRSGAVLTVVGEAVPGGSATPPIGAGQAMRIFTGATVPDGADHVVMQEHTARDGEHGMVTITGGSHDDSHIRRSGSDFATGQAVLDAGTRLSARALVAAAAADCGALVVTRRPRVAIIATGDELAAPGTAVRNDRLIPDSITPGIAACVADWGGVVGAVARLGDHLPALIAAAGSALVAADVLVITGGASVGDRDFVKAMVAPHGLTMVFDTVAMKPGRPVWCGRIAPVNAGGEPDQGTWVIGLPGNPTSAMVTARLFLAPLIAALLGQIVPDPLAWRMLPLAAPLPATGARAAFVRARWDADGLVPLANQDSGAQSPLAAADYLIRCAPHQAAKPAPTAVCAVAL